MKSLEIKFKNERPENGQTKFGGQPDWVTEPEWPISKRTGKPMRFICQTNLKDVGLTNIDAKVAYLFMTDDDKSRELLRTWEPDGGENAMILQPGDNKVATETRTVGPSLRKSTAAANNEVRRRNEFPIREFVPNTRRRTLKEFECSVGLVEITETEACADSEVMNKLGGKPVFLQNDEYPSDANWDLLIQLDSLTLPFSINLGDGVGYGFISEDRKTAKFLWQAPQREQASVNRHFSKKKSEI